MRKLFIAGNWKMNMLYDEALAFFAELEHFASDKKSIDIALFVPSIYLTDAGKTAKNFIVGAENIYFEEKGAFTGEISPTMLKSINISWTLIGHSERRNLFGETDEWVNKKVQIALKNNIFPVVCVGEKLEEREHGITMEIIGKQVKELFYGITKEDAKKIIIAYEPIWAIGTGKTASPSDAETVHAGIRDIVKTLYDEEVANSLRILYGGSVKPSNAEALLKEKDIDGALIGGASLKTDDFFSISTTAISLRKV